MIKNLHMIKNIKDMYFLSDRTLQKIFIQTNDNKLEEKM
jgi:hypothetical protein